MPNSAFKVSFTLVLQLYFLARPSCHSTSVSFGFYNLFGLNWRYNVDLESVRISNYNNLLN